MSNKQFGLNLSSNSCRRHPPIPYEELSASTTVGFEESKYANKGAVVNISLIFLNDSICSGPQVQAVSFIKSRFSGFDTVDRCGTYLQR